MRIKDTSLVYSYSISVCMGSFVFGYQLSSFSNLKELILSVNFPEGIDSGNTFLLLSSVLALAAIFGKDVNNSRSWNLPIFNQILRLHSDIQTD